MSVRVLLYLVLHQYGQHAHVHGSSNLDVRRPRPLLVSVLVEQLHPLEGVHGLDEADVLLVLDVGVKDQVLTEREGLDAGDARLHLVPTMRKEEMGPTDVNVVLRTKLHVLHCTCIPVRIQHWNVDLPNLAEGAEDLLEDELAGPISGDPAAVLVVDEPFGGQVLQVDGVGALSGLPLVHHLVVVEEGVPVIAGRERRLGLGSADLQRLKY